MPYINTVVNVPIPEKTEKELADAYGKTIGIIKGKTENWLMLNFTENSHMYFAGSNSPTAMVEIMVFGSAPESEYEELTAAVCSLINEKLGIPKNRIYVKYGEYDKWGWNSCNF